MSKVKEDAVFEAAKKKLGEAIDAIDVKDKERIPDLVKLVGVLTEMKEVETRANEGGFGSALPT